MIDFGQIQEQNSLANATVSRLEGENKIYVSNSKIMPLKNKNLDREKNSILPIWNILKG